VEGQAERTDLQAAVAAVAERVAPAVVGFGQGLGTGSGVVVAPGRVLTNAHNVRGADLVVGFADGRRARGIVSGTDMRLDLAAVKVDTGDVQPIDWRPESVGVVAGAPVIALSNRGGRGLRAWLGSVSAVDREIRVPGGRAVASGIEHDAPLPHASGGGPLVDLDGRLLGLNAVRLKGGRIVALPADEDFAARADRLFGSDEAQPSGGVALGMEQGHPLFERIEVLADQPPYGRALLERLGPKGLHVGCGPNMAHGWLNTDFRVLVDRGGGASVPGRIVRGTAAGHRERYFLSHDALDPYPIEDAALDVAYAEHFIEHIPREAGIQWLREVRRVLRPGGFLRLSTPDLRRYVEGYLEPVGSFFDTHRRVLVDMAQFADSGVPDTRGFMVNQIFRFFGHQWIYDIGEMRAVAAAAGFDPDAVAECSFQQGRLPEVAGMDKPERADESLYVEIPRS
jgi:predicted SAM-dependent methyltransferase